MNWPMAFLGTIIVAAIVFIYITERIDAIDREERQAREERNKR